MSDLAKSRWAPSTTTTELKKLNAQSTTSSDSSLWSASQELSRFMKIVARLKWKLPFLAESYRLASGDSVTGINNDIDIAHAEVMFKIDFHEYYALLERAIVHLLGVFGVTVSRSFAAQLQTTTPLGTHRYHANVLEALAEKTGPLYSVLGRGGVHEQLKKAKELRNRWKTVDTIQEESTRKDTWDRSRRAKGEQVLIPLVSYDFEKMLAVIFEGLDNAYCLAKQYVAESEGEVNNDAGGNRNNSETDWDFIVDAMDWEAV